ncbi:MAG: M23 family metallopeptidase [Candidatus Dojkabacteria bacterium]|nr:M23 family metallopeptidase [Candidatus Dojkabacteria bacterium]
MAKNRDEKQDIGTLGQIYDFIFKEAEKPPEKRRPVKGASLGGGNSELVDALAAALESPGLYMSDQILDVFNDALDIKLGTFKTDEFSPTAKFDFKLSTLSQFLDDPNGVLDKAIKSGKEARKLARAQYMGKAVQEFVAMGWARKNNLDLDAISAIHGSYGLRHGDLNLPKRVREEEFRKARAMGTVAGGSNLGILGMKPEGGISKLSETAPLIARSGDLVGRKLIGISNWNALSANDRDEFLKLYSSKVENINGQFFKQRIPNIQLPPDFDTRGNRYRFDSTKVFDQNGKRIDYKGKFVDISTGDWNIDKDTYIKLERENIQGRIGNMLLYLQTNRANMSPQEIRNLEMGIDRLRKTEILVSGQTLDQSNLRSARTEISRQLDEYRSRLSRATTPEERRMYKDQIKDLRSNMSGLSIMAAAGFVGQLDGYITSWKNIVGNGNLGMSLMNGKFFDKRYNSIFAPGKASKIDVGKDQVTILLAGDSNTELGKAYNKLMTGLYYLTPKSIAKTLFYNGEGFLYLHKISGAEWARKAGKIFSFNSRMRDRVTNFVNDKILKKLRQGVEKVLAKKFTGEAAKLLTKWVAKGGVQVLGRAIATYILHAIGAATTGGVANIVIAILGDKITDVLLKVGKVVLITLMYIIFGVIAIGILLGDSATTKFYSDNYSYTHEAPGEVLACGSYTGISPIIDDEASGEIKPFNGGPLPSNVECLIGPDSFRCSQGVYGSYSHKNVAATDIPGVQTFYAPQFCGNDNCVVTAVTDVNCADGYAGGMVIFTASYNSVEYTFKLIHVEQNVSVGQKLSAGGPVADIIQNNDRISECSTGSHLHLEVKVNGSSVDPMDVLTEPTSSGGFGCNISACP